MEENVEDSISNIYDTIKELLPEDSDTLNQLDANPSLTPNVYSPEDKDNQIVDEVESKQDVQDILENILEDKEQEVISNYEVNRELQNNLDESNEQKKIQELPKSEQSEQSVQGILDNIQEEKETELIQNIEKDQQIQGILDDIQEEKETELIQNIKEEQEVQGILNEIKEEPPKPTSSTNLSPDLKRNIPDEIYEDLEQDVLNEYKESQVPLEENTNIKIEPKEQKEDIFQANFDVIPKNEETLKTIIEPIEPKLEINNNINDVTPQTTTLEDSSKSDALPAKNTKQLFNQITPSSQETPSIFDNNNLLDQSTDDTTNNTQTYFSTPNLESAEPITFNRFLQPEIESLDEEKLVDLFKNIQPQEEQTTYEPASELPQNDMFVEAETKQDETSEQILSNTEKTNTTLQSLAQLLATLIQSGGMQGQGTNQAVPVPVPTGSDNARPGVPDAVLASNQGMIPNIRSKFLYSV